MTKYRKIIIAGGHLTPAQAVIAEFKKRGGWKIYYLGRKHSLEGVTVPSIESEIVPQMGVIFIPIPAGRLQRRLTYHLILNFVRLPLALFYSFYLLLKIKPDAILSFGGYVSVPPVIAGWLLRIPVFTHEQTIIYGLANKINSLFTQTMFASFPESLKHFSGKRVILAGNPIRKEVFNRHPSVIEKRLAGDNFPLIYITAGSQGSQAINKAVIEALPQLLKKYRIIHQCGKLDYKNLQSQISHVKSISKKRYFLTDYVGPKDIGWVLNKADLIVSRAGANTICELAALGKPAILIPIPWSSQNEQAKNAQLLVNIGSARILPQCELSGSRLAKEVKLMLSQLDIYIKSGQKAKRLVSLDAAQKIVDEIENET